MGDRKGWTLFQMTAQITRKHQNKTHCDERNVEQNCVTIHLVTVWLTIWGKHGEKVTPMRIWEDDQPPEDTDERHSSVSLILEKAKTNCVSLSASKIRLNGYNICLWNFDRCSMSITSEACWFIIFLPVTLIICVIWLSDFTSPVLSLKWNLHHFTPAAIWSPSVCMCVQPFGPRWHHSYNPMPIMPSHM